MKYNKALSLLRKMAYTITAFFLQNTSGKSKKNLHGILFPWLRALLLLSQGNRTGQRMIIGKLGDQDG